MSVIDPQFKNVFSDMENEYLLLRQKLNSVAERGNDLEDRLTEELACTDNLASYHNQTAHLFDIAESFNTIEKESHRQFVRNSAFSKIIQEAPYYWRIINKPEGYTGDAEMMRIIYDSQFEGNTPFGMLMHKHATLCDACQAVRNRRHFLKQQIHSKKGKILSIAAGPAMEMLDVLSTEQSKDTYHFHAFDHDIKTIQKVARQCSDPRLQYLVGNAFNLIKGNYKVAIPRKGMITFCQPRKDFKGINRFVSPVKYRFRSLEENNYDLVYSAGLYDYIKTYSNEHSKGTIALTEKLFRLVKPGGSLVIGNFSHKNPKDLKFVMEYICDWVLIHRTRQEMLDFAQTIPDREIRNIEVLEEPLGINYFLKIDKAVI
jgi:extracellular factor (EF) 3-hydroxypalmitic acid methyl ester biosynthesis protein